MSSEKTPNLGLHKWQAVDYVQRTEFNDNFAKIDDHAKQVTEQLAHTNTQLTTLDSKKVTKDEGGTITWGMIAQDAREQISGDKVAVVARNSVLPDTIVKGAVTLSKAGFINIETNNMLSQLLDIQYRDGYYYSYSTQNYLENASRTVTVDFITVEPLKAYYTNASTFVFFDELYNPIGYADRGSNSSITTIEGTKFVLINFNDKSVKERYMYPSGVGTAYSSEKSTIKIDDRILLNKGNVKNLLFADGTISDSMKLVLPMFDLKYRTTWGIGGLTNGVPNGDVTRISMNERAYAYKDITVSVTDASKCKIGGTIYPITGASTSISLGSQSSFVIPAGNYYQILAGYQNNGKIEELYGEVFSTIKVSDGSTYKNLYDFIAQTNVNKPDTVIKKTKSLADVKHAVSWDLGSLNGKVFTVGGTKTRMGMVNELYAYSNTVVKIKDGFKIGGYSYSENNVNSIYYALGSSTTIIIPKGYTFRIIVAYSNDAQINNVYGDIFNAISITNNVSDKDIYTLLTDISKNNKSLQKNAIWNRTIETPQYKQLKAYANGLKTISDIDTSKLVANGYDDDKTVLFTHGSNMVIDSSGTAYVVNFENINSVGESYNDIRVVLTVMSLDGSTKNKYICAEPEVTYGDYTIKGSAYCPHVILFNGRILVRFAAKLNSSDDSAWTLVIREFSPTTNTFISFEPLTFVYNGVEYPYNNANINATVSIDYGLQFIAGAIADHSSNNDNAYNGYYYSAVCADTNFKGMVVRTNDFKKYEFVSVPDFEMDTLYEIATYTLGDTLYCAFRQNNNVGRVVVAKYNIAKGTWDKVDCFSLIACSSRPYFVFYKNALYLMVNGTSRHEMSIYLINTTNLVLSYCVSTFEYPVFYYFSPVAFGDYIYMSYTGISVDMSSTRQTMMCRIKTDYNIDINSKMRTLLNL